MKLVRLTDDTRNLTVFINPEHVQAVHASGKGSLIELHGSVITIKESIDTVVYRLQGGADA